MKCDGVIVLCAGEVACLRSDGVRNVVAISKHLCGAATGEGHHARNLERFEISKNFAPRKFGAMRYVMYMYIHVYTCTMTSSKIKGILAGIYR